MKEMKAIDIRNKYLEFFKSKGHNMIPSSLLVPENDPSVLFNTAGMQPLVPYLLGQKHPLGTRLTDYQKCVRTVDIDEVGDNCHLTYFEMLGNWSLGDYFKSESIKMSYEFLIDVLGLPKDKLYVSCFEGDIDCSKDLESYNTWKALGIPDDRIYFFGKDQNWWIAGDTGPCGPDTEMFYDTGKEKCSKDCNPSCKCGKYVEIWNNVFMEFYKDENGYRELKQKNVDTGLGLERMTMLMEGKDTPFEIEVFKPVMDRLEQLEKYDLIDSRRIVADHLRSSIMIINDGVVPSNVDRGYILRRLLRRATRHLRKLDISDDYLPELIEILIDSTSDLYPELIEFKDRIISVVVDEKNKFLKTLSRGEKEFNKKTSKLEKGSTIDSKIVFNLYETYGFPPEMTEELAHENGLKTNMDELSMFFKEHQEKSRIGSDQKFKGGLASTGEMETKYHTATHLLNAALKQVLGDHVHQKGSNITEERMRFDFSHPSKMTESEKKETEDLVNKWIDEGLDVVKEEMPKEDAINSGAECMFIEKYPDIVTVYSIGDVSKELCGGPHVKNTKELGHFRIIKEESSSSGVRRIKAVLE